MAELGSSGGGGRATARVSCRPLVGAAVVVVVLVAASVVTASGGVVSPPAAPQDLAAAADGRDLHVTWRKPASSGGAAIGSYTLQYRRTTRTTWRTLTVDEGRAATVTGLNRGAFRIRVAAVNRIGRGEWATITADNRPPEPTPTPGPTPTPAPTPNPSCDASYPTVCIPPPPPDLDCGEIQYANFTVVGTDPHGFDGDNDGIGCES